MLSAAEYKIPRIYSESFLCVIIVMSGRQVAGGSILGRFYQQITTSEAGVCVM